MKRDFIKAIMRLTLIIIFICLYDLGLSQNEFFSETIQQSSTKKSGFQSSKLFFGGNFGLQFGDYSIIELSPLIGYRITEKLSAGIQINYNFIHISSLKISTSIYGLSLFTNYYFSKSIFGRAEYEWLSLESKYFNPAIYNESKRFNLHNILVGGGYRQQIGERSFVTLMILWNLNDNALSPYENPIIRMSFEL